MSSRRALWVLLWAALLALGILLLLWSLKDVPFADLGQVLSALGPGRIALLVIVNIAILLIFPWRWSLILRAQKFHVPYLALVQYRLVSFAISYFTPGQNFGGEPLQVLYLRDRHKVPGSAALASVTLDRVIELTANFAVLALGLAIVLLSGLVADLPLGQTLPLSLGLLLAPVGYLAAVSLGKHPVGAVLGRFSGRMVQGIRNAEAQLGELAQKQPGLLLKGFAVAGLVWAALIFEIWLSLFLLDLKVGALELALVVVASRVALLAPTPGALGALEASQVLAMQALGYGPAYGLSLALLIRARDIFFGLAGLMLAGIKRP